MNSDLSLLSCVISPGLNFSERDLLLGIVEDVIMHHGGPPSEMKDVISQAMESVVNGKPR